MLNYLLYLFINHECKDSKTCTLNVIILMSNRYITAKEEAVCAMVEEDFPDVPELGDQVSGYLII